MRAKSPKSLVERLEAIAMEKAERCFTNDYRKTADPQDMKERALGILISGMTEWDGAAIMRIFSSALEDANFHSENAIVQGWIKGYMPTEQTPMKAGEQ